MSRVEKLYPFIEAEKQNSHAGRDGNIARACELLKVSRSAYYAHATARAVGGSRRQREDADLAERIRHHHAASKGRNGAPGSTPTWPARAAGTAASGSPG